MNEYIQTILIVLGALGALGLVAGGIGFLLSALKKGERSEKTDVINTSQEVINFWKGQAENYQTILSAKEKDWNEKFSNMSKEMGHIQGQLTAEKVQNERLEKIFQNRNPEQEKFMEFVVKAIIDQNAVNKEIVNLLGDIHRLAIEEHNREMKVETTITKTS